jgi:hypothetical protein
MLRQALLPDSCMLLTCCFVLLMFSCLQVGESRRKVDMLREAAQGGLGLGSGGKAARGQQVGTTQSPAACCCVDVIASHSL